MQCSPQHKISQLRFNKKIHSTVFSHVLQSNSHELAVTLQGSYNTYFKFTNLPTLTISHKDLIYYGIFVGYGTYWYILEHAYLHTDISDIGCSLMELWDLSTTNAIFLNDVSLLANAAQYRSCVTDNISSAVLKDTALNIATVAYYNGTTPGSTACFVCDGHELNVTINERVCQTDATWSGGPITCGMYNYLSVSL